MAKTPKKLTHVADCVAFDGTPTTIWVYTAGRSFYIATQSQEHLCHPSVTDMSGVKREIALVFQARVENFREQ